MNATQYRTIRSFACRGGRLTSEQAKALEHIGPQYLVSFSKGQSLQELFICDQPIILEIGFGMAHSLLEQAEHNPALNFLGVEVYRPGIGALLAGIAKKALSNIRIIHEDIMLLLEKLPAESFQGVQIFFPDPWPKRRHHKRRLIQQVFVEKLAQKIKPKGYLHCATDWEEYALQMQEAIRLSAAFKPATFMDQPLNRLATKFEKRGLKLGHRVWDVIAFR